MLRSTDVIQPEQVRRALTRLWYPFNDGEINPDTAEPPNYRYQPSKVNTPDPPLEDPPAGIKPFQQSFRNDATYQHYLARLQQRRLVSVLKMIQFSLCAGMSIV